MQVELQSSKVALCADGRHSGQVRAGVAMSDLFPVCVVVNPSFFFPFLVIKINIDNIQRSKCLHLQKYKKDTVKIGYILRIQKRQCDKNNVKNGYILRNTKKTM